MTSTQPIESNDHLPIKIEHWAPIEGRWSLTKSSGSASFQGSTAASAANLGPTLANPLGLALAAGKLRNGQISTTIKAEKTKPKASASRNAWSNGGTAGILFGFQNTSTRYFAAALGLFNHAYGLLTFDPGAGWHSITSSGSSSNLEIEKDYKLHLDIRGQSVSLTVNGAEVIGNYCLPEPITGASFGLYAWGDGSFGFKSSQFVPQKPEAFVVMPFAEPYDTLYHVVIKQVTEQEGFNINRVDEIRGPGIIIDDIRRQIELAHVVVAEVSTHNPNVFYEVGYAHALKKPVILLARRGGERELPFDLQPYRVIFYNDSIGGKEEVERVLRDHLRSVLR